MRALLSTSLVVVVAMGTLVELWHGLWPSDAAKLLLPFFSLSYERNLPTWYSSSLLLACALALAAIATRVRGFEGRWRAWWWGLAGVFAYMSLDEAVELHEFLPDLLWLDAGQGMLYFAWVVPGAIVVSLVGTAFLPFLLSLPRPVRIRFVLAGAVYVGGALGMELPLGLWTERHGSDNLGYALIDVVEETMEMAGAILFLRALLDHLQSLRGEASSP